jgi:dTDP-4-amino-4,6-dideoxygalactose transaminase
MDWDIPIIEDCAHAFGITLNGKPLGGRTHAAILSFYATKLIGAGEGGAILTNSEELAQFVRSWRDYSDQPPDGTRLNDKMTDLEATLALCQLDRLQDMIVARQELAKRYHDLLAREATCTNMFRLPDISRSRIWYRYAVEMRNAPARAVVDHLDRYGIHAAEPVTDWRPSGSPECPEASSAYRHVVSLPLYPTLTPEEQDRVVHAFLAFCREHTYT